MGNNQRIRMTRMYEVWTHDTFEYMYVYTIYILELKKRGILTYEWSLIISKEHVPMPIWYLFTSDNERDSHDEKNKRSL